MKELFLRFTLLILLVLLSVGCGPEITPGTSPPVDTPRPPTETEEAAVSTVEPEPKAEIEEGELAMVFKLTSTVFDEGDPIPKEFTCDGEDISPPLQWTDPPEGTVSFALIADDPDAPVGTWVHWVIYNLPTDARSLPIAFPLDADSPDGSKNGENSWGRLGYGGPCPPGGTHRYFFKLYALDQILDLEAGATKEQLLEAMESYILGETELMGTYTR
ncbi:MAG: YbhB/YbcL family Raf kinase inhibitor-like protein [Anaerolineaceae bacterium]|nr:MAG: YbhB/YbcL family Raf kinase inhibitor-like protein [Anaerolineaceae bacterium]